MFRATRASFAAAALLALLALSYWYRGAGAEATVMNGTGLLDYSVAPDFKVGTYVSYATVQTVRGITEPGEPVTLLIPGEERFWGDDCFWVESRQGESSILSLMSYSIYQDSFPQYRMRFYTRKSIMGVDDDGNLDEEITQMPPMVFKSRNPLPSGEHDKVTRLGVDTVMTPIGTFSCEKIETRHGTGTTQDIGDSTEYTEEYEVRTSYMTPKIPLTHLAREDVDVTLTRKAWRIGHSDASAPMLVMRHSAIGSRVIGFGQGMKSVAFPLERQVSIQRLSATSATPAKKSSAGTTAKKSSTTSTKPTTAR